MKRLISILAILAAGVAGAMAQQAVAVLTHDGTSKTFNGYTALQDAYAASAGDLITLSSGTFASIATIEKALTIRGAGMEYDSIYHTQATILEGDFTLALPDTETGRFQLEGIYHGGTIFYNYVQKNPQFIKCRLGSITGTSYTVLGTDYSSQIVNANFFHCRISADLICYANSSISAINSFINHPVSYSETTSVFSLQNCVIQPYHYTNLSGLGGYLYNSTVINCIFAEIYSGKNLYWDNNTAFINCLLPSRYAPETSRSTYQTYEKIQVVFDTYTGTYTDAEDFTMRDEMKVLYCDENGSELGMYGGSFPYSPRVAGPHLSLFNVAPHSTTDGKLRVRLQVESTTE